VNTANASPMKPKDNRDKLVRFGCGRVTSISVRVSEQEDASKAYKVAYKTILIL
jgi:hypothetical protein